MKAASKDGTTNRVRSDRMLEGDVVFLTYEVVREALART